MATRILGSSKGTKPSLPGLLGIAPLSRQDIVQIVEDARKLKGRSLEGIRSDAPLKGRRIMTLFFESSSRTKLSFTIAGRTLGADVLDFPTSTSSMSKGESLKDTVLTVEALGIDAVILRHPASGSPVYLSKIIAPPVVNAGDGSNEHPTQALLDLLAIRERLGRIEQLTIAMVGDVLHSRVARSNIYAHQKLGNRILLVGPPTLVPDSLRGSYPVEIHHDLDRVLPEADVVVMLRIQQERMKEQFFPSLREYHHFFALDERRTKLLKKSALIMHPGPMNRDVEITGHAADSEQAAITQQVAAGVYTRMAVLNLVLAERGKSRH